MNLNEQEIKSLIDDYSSQYEEDTQFLLDHGWTKKSDDPNCKLYVSPKGEEHGHHYGLFMKEGERLAINVAKNDIVLESFIQFQVQVFNDDDDDDDEPYDFFFPCIKDGELYWYDEAVGIAVYKTKIVFDWDRWLNLKSELVKLDLKKIKQGDLIEVKEVLNEVGDWDFKLR